MDLCGGVDDDVHRYDRADHVISAPFDDATPIPEHFLDHIVPEVIETLRAGKRVLIHCVAGLSRSASVAYAVIRVKERVDHDTALRRVKTPDIPEYPHPVVLGSARAWLHGPGPR